MSEKKTLEEALADMEASNAKAAQLRKEQAPELLAEALRITALNARLAALPQSQRRQVLDAAGRKQESAAPPPIRPLSGRTSIQAQAKENAAQPVIAWHFWMSLRTLKLWQACALVADLNPDLLKRSPQEWMAVSSARPVFDARSFPNAGAEQRFDKALRLACSAVSYMHGPIYPQGALRPGNPGEKDVMLSEVVAFFRSCEWPDIPNQLRATLAAPGAALREPTTIPRRTLQAVNEVNGALMTMDDRASVSSRLHMPDAQEPQAAPVVAASVIKPWLVEDPNDPAPEQSWYTPARYFARQLVLKDSTLLTKKLTLAEKVSMSLYGVGIYKRGGTKQRHAADTVLKAFSNVALS